MDLFEVSLASTLLLKPAAFPSKSLFLMKSGNALPFIHDKYEFSVSVSTISGFCLRATLPSIWWSILGICEDGLKGLALSLFRNLSSGPLLILIGGNRGHASVIGGHSLLPAGWQGRCQEVQISTKDLVRFAQPVTSRIVNLHFSDEDKCTRKAACYLRTSFSRRALQHFSLSSLQCIAMKRLPFQVLICKNTGSEYNCQV